MTEFTPGVLTGRVRSPSGQSGPGPGAGGGAVGSVGPGVGYGAGGGGETGSVGEGDGEGGSGSGTGGVVMPAGCSSPARPTPPPGIAQTYYRRLDRTVLRDQRQRAPSRLGKLEWWLRVLVW